MISDIKQTGPKDSKTYHVAMIIAMSAGFILTVWFASLTFARSQSVAAITLENRINPNTASAASIARLPGIGINLADRIVKYRDSFALKDQGRPAFERPEDLKNVSGIGPKKSDKIRDLVKFK